MARLDPHTPEGREEIQFRILKLIPSFSFAANFVFAFVLGLACAGLYALVCGAFSPPLPNNHPFIPFGFGFGLGIWPWTLWFLWGKWRTGHYERLLRLAR